jgi:thymidylate synthase
MNKLDHQYTDLLKTIIEHGLNKKDRTGTGTRSIFGYTIRHNMAEGFPLLTTKKMPFKTILTELLWFLRGDTNIKYLVDNDCHIWDGDAYKNYVNKTKFPGGDTVPKIEFMYHDSAILTQEEFINKIKTDDEFAKKWGELGPIYGKQWRSWHFNAKFDMNGKYHEEKGIDQIQNLINDLKTNPDSRRLMVNAWNVGELDQMVLPPCHYGFQLYTREMTNAERCEYWAKRCGKDISYTKNLTDEKLNELFCPSRKVSLMWNQRSCDTFLGLPFNIASYGLLLTLIGEIVNMVPDQLIGNLGDTHLYLNHLEQAKEQITREPYALPTVSINTEFWLTEGGECGIGLINTDAILSSFNNEHFCKCLLEEDIQLVNYVAHPSIKAPLSN